MRRDSYVSDTTTTAEDADSANFARRDKTNRSQLVDYSAAVLPPEGDVGLSLDDDLHAFPTQQIGLLSDLYLIQSTTNLSIEDSDSVHLLKRSRSNETFGNPTSADRPTT